MSSPDERAAALNPDLQFRITFHRGAELVASVTGSPQPYRVFNVGDVASRMYEAEAYLERLTGFRVNIETAGE
jgi:hypothetical protein